MNKITITILIILIILFGGVAFFVYLYPQLERAPGEGIEALEVLSPTTQQDFVQEVIDESYCLALEDSGERDGCLVEYSITRVDSSACDSISTEIGKVSCIEQLPGEESAFYPPNCSDIPLSAGDPICLTEVLDVSVYPGTTMSACDAEIEENIVHCAVTLITTPGQTGFTCSQLARTDLHPECEEQLALTQSFLGECPPGLSEEEFIACAQPSYEALIESTQ